MATKATLPRPVPAPDLPQFELRIDPAAPPGNVLVPLARLLLARARREAAARTAEAEKGGRSA